MRKPSPTMHQKLEKHHSVPRRQKAPLTKVGFYGCVGRVIRLESTDYYPINIRIACPGCGHDHIVKPFWRRMKEELDTGVVPDLILVRPVEDETRV